MHAMQHYKRNSFFFFFMWRILTSTIINAIASKIYRQQKSEIFRLLVSPDGADRIEDISFSPWTLMDSNCVGWFWIKQIIVINCHMHTQPQVLSNLISHWLTRMLIQLHWVQSFQDTTLQPTKYNLQEHNNCFIFSTTRTFQIASSKD